MGKSKTANRCDAQTPTPKQPATSAWTRLAKQLGGLLSIHINEPFVDLDHLCPRSAWLVIHLDLIRPVTNIPLALDALAVLCVRSERLRLDDKLHEAYWRQMLTSGIMREPPSANSPTVSKFIRFVKHKNVRVMLSWQGKRFQSTVSSYLRSFLEASTAKYDAIADSLDGESKWRVWRSLHVGIRFADSSLTRGDIHTIKVMLTSTREDAAQAGSNMSSLCEQHTLSKLDLRGNCIGLDHLRELASLLEDPLCRRIDDLNLEKTFPDDVVRGIDNTYAMAFKRVVTAASTTKPLTTTSTYVRADAGFAISLAHNTMYDGLHLKILHDILETNTRPLRALSLAYTKHKQTEDSKSSSRKWLAHICMTSPPTSFTEDALLDLTLADVDLDNDRFHDELVDVVVSRLREALDRGVAVCCAVRRRETETYPSKDCEFRYHHFLEQGVLYPVVEVLPDGWCRVALVVEDESDDDDDEDEERAYWIPFSSIAGISLEDESGPDIMRMRFSALVCDGDNDQFGVIDSPISADVEDFVVSVGREIQRLSVRRWRDRDSTLAYLLGQCPNLCQLDVEGSMLSSFTLEPSHWATLKAINMSGAKMGSNFWTSLTSRLEEHAEAQATASHRNSFDEREEEREEVPLVKLRYVSMLDCKLTVREVGYLRDALALNKTLELVELDSSVIPTKGVDDEPTPSKMAQSVSLDHDGEQLQSTPLTLDRRVAFACVLRNIPQLRDADIDSAVLSRCVEYAGNITTRRIVWSDPLPVRKWFRPHQPPP